MKKTKTDLIEHCKKALKDNVQYVYGAKMEVLSYDRIKELQKIYGYGNVWISDLKKAGKLCCDCSGLISSCTGIVRNSTGYKQTALETVTVNDVKKNWEKYVGWAFWLQGHIGVVSEKEGYYYAMDGSARNMVHYPMERQNWVYALKLCDIDYSDTDKGDEEMIETGNIKINGKDIKINKILKDGRNFIELRGLENAGFKVDYNEQSKLMMLNNVISPININVDGTTDTVESVNLNGYNYVKLRDIGDATKTFETDFQDGEIKITRLALP